MNKAYIPALALLVLLAVLHFTANHFYLYSRYPGFDILMHIMGTTGITFAVYWVVITYLNGKPPSLLVVALIALSAGLAWEIMEYFYDIAGAPVGTHRYYLDTAKDILDDSIGIGLACLALHLRKKIPK